jgi:hypothetical protein
MGRLAFEDASAAGEFFEQRACELRRISDDVRQSGRAVHAWSER